MWTARRMDSYQEWLLGRIPASSFCERINSIAKDVMTDGHTAMKQDSLEKLVVLRMNREFMQYMRKKYNHLSKQQFGQTLVQLRAKRDNNKKWEWC